MGPGVARPGVDGNRPGPRRESSGRLGASWTQAPSSASTDSPSGTRVSRRSTASPSRCRAAGSGSSAPTAPARRPCSACCSAWPTRPRAPSRCAASTSPPIRSACAARLGYMPEHDCLPLDQTAADVVATFGELSGLPARAARQRASDILDLVGLDEARFRPIGGFSTGMRQRTKLAQSLVGDPELVLLDEPTAGLDPLGRDEMLALVARLGTFGISVLMATHLLDDVQQVCDHVLMIDAGHLVVSGMTESLLERTGRVTVDVGVGWPELLARLERVPLPAVATDGLVDVTIEGDHQLDVLRDVVAELGLPLHRLSTRLTSLDEVFLDRSGGPR